MLMLLCWKIKKLFKSLLTFVFQFAHYCLLFKWLSKGTIFKCKTKNAFGGFMRGERKWDYVVLCVSYTETHILCKACRNILLLYLNPFLSIYVVKDSLYKKLLPKNHVFECSHTFPLTNTLMFQMVISTFV